MNTASLLSVALAPPAHFTHLRLPRHSARHGVRPKVKGVHHPFLAVAFRGTLAQGSHRANTPSFVFPRSRLDCTCNAAQAGCTHEDFLDLGDVYISQTPHTYLNILGRTVWCAVLISGPHTS